MSTLKLWQTWTCNNSWSIAIAFDHWTLEHPKAQVHRTQLQRLGWDLWHHTITWLKLWFQHLHVTACCRRVNSSDCSVQNVQNQRESGNMMQHESTGMLEKQLSSSFLAFIPFQNIWKSYEILTPTDLPWRVLGDHIHGVYLFHLLTQEFLDVGNAWNCRRWISRLALSVSEVDDIEIEACAKVGSHNLLRTVDIWRCFSGTNLKPDLDKHMLRLSQCWESQMTFGDFCRGKCLNQSTETLAKSAKWS